MAPSYSSVHSHLRLTSPLNYFPDSQISIVTGFVVCISTHVTSIGLPRVSLTNPCRNFLPDGTDLALMRRLAF